MLKTFHRRDTESTEGAQREHNSALRILCVLCVSAVNLFLLSAAVAKEQAEAFRAEFHQTYPLPATGRVSLKNVSGSVRIVGWDRNEVKIDAVKSARSKESLDEADVKVEASANAIHIKTSYPNDCCFYAEDCCEKRFYRSRESQLASVEYTVTVPRNARVESVDVIKGNIKIEGLSGTVIASTILGELESKLTRLSDANSVTLSSLTGGITLYIPSDSNAHLIARSLSSEINSDFGLTMNRGKYIGRNVAGRLGRGGARVTLDNITGNIAIRRLPDGRKPSVVTNLRPQDVRAETEADAVRSQTLARRIGVRARIQAEQALVNSANISQAMREVQRQVARAMRESLPIAINISMPRITVNPTPAPTEQPPREARPPRAPRPPRTAATPGATPPPRVETPDPPPAPHHPDAGYFRLSETESKSFTVRGITRINLDTFDGQITVRAWDKAEVMITATKKARDEASMRNARVRFEQGATEIAAIARFDDQDDESDSDDAEVYLNAFVPRKANLRLATSDGQLLVEGVSGELELRTDDGAIQVGNGTGRLRANTSDGRILVTRFNGDVDARTNDGEIALEGRFSSLSARTGDGSITLSVPASFNATVETVAESIIIEGLSVSEESDSSSRLRRWRIGSGGTVLSLRTGDGRIVLRRSGA
ncbi:MAG TPA: DUF4097 family beta strand repeat-containing protein [Blastocatellia bacterium]|nr:DUF4097 family beta strand repeat-containing protein [Blastocatellia bacterium]